MTVSKVSNFLFAVIFTDLTCLNQIKFKIDIFGVKQRFFIKVK